MKFIKWFNLINELRNKEIYDELKRGDIIGVMEIFCHEIIWGVVDKYDYNCQELINLSMFNDNDEITPTMEKILIKAMGVKN